MIRSIALFLSLAVTATVAEADAQVPVAAPHVHSDFSSYTLSLTWQPAFCSGHPGCDSDQPHAPLIGLHGLWASLPDSLASAGVPTLTWWQQGCDLLQHSDAAPPLDPGVLSRVLAVMPHQSPSLLVHEYDKHVQCFAFDPNAFFTTEVGMHDAVANSSFGSFLVAHAGQTVSHADAVAAFASAFKTAPVASLSLVCEHATGEAARLSEIRMAIAVDGLANFPAGTSLIAAPVPQDTCPSEFTLPLW